jgi:hypothetical protein
MFPKAEYIKGLQELPWWVAICRGTAANCQYLWVLDNPPCPYIMEIPFEPTSTWYGQSQNVI